VLASSRQIIPVPVRNRSIQVLRRMQSVQYWSSILPTSYQLIQSITQSSPLVTSPDIAVPHRYPIDRLNSSSFATKA
jgi:hypothetical protein